MVILARVWAILPSVATGLEVSKRLSLTHAGFMHSGLTEDSFQSCEIP